MSTIQIKNDDRLFELLKTKLQQGQLISMTAPSGFSYRFKIQTDDIEVLKTIEEFSGTSFDNYTFNFNTDSKVFAKEMLNYNAIEFYKTPQRISETSITTVYETTPEQFQNLFDNYKSGLYVNPPSVHDTQTISISEKLDKSIINSNKYYLPFYNVFNFTNSVNSFYKFLLHHDVYELMIETFNSLNLFEESLSVNGGEVLLKTIDSTNLLSNLVSDPQNFKIFHSPVFKESERWGLVYDNIDKLLFESHLEKFVNEHAPSYMQMLTGDKTPFIETVFYRIEKYIANSASPIQIFYIPASDTNREFIDNQVVFGTEYNYKINVIGAAFGNRYEYFTKTTDQGMVVDVREKKISKLYQMNIHDHSALLVGIAPTKPEITFMNNSGPDKSIRIYFEPDFHETRENFIQILESDSQNQSYAMRDEEQKIIHRLGKDFLNFQIFKLNKKPSSYEDFSNSLYAEVIGTDRSSSEVHKMFLAPNRKHYFTFRTRNGFNLFSNPTPIYEVELIQDADETKILSKIVNLQQETKDKTREFGRFLRIYPAFEQILLREFEPSDPSDVTYFDNLRLPAIAQTESPTIRFNNKMYYVGETENPLWGKKFKFRIRSKNTGKILDINVDFTLKKKESEADF